MKSSWNFVVKTFFGKQSLRTLPKGHFLKCNYSWSLFWFHLITEGASSRLQRNSSFPLGNYLFGIPTIFEKTFRRIQKIKIFLEKWPLDFANGTSLCFNIDSKFKYHFTFCTPYLDVMMWKSRFTKSNNFSWNNKPTTKNTSAGRTNKFFKNLTLTKFDILLFSSQDSKK